MTQCPPHELKIRRYISIFLLVAALGFIYWQGGRLDQQQQAMRETQEARDLQLRRAELIVISAPIALVMCGPDRTITVTNPATEQLFGYSYAEMIGQSIDLIIPPEFHAEHNLAFTRALVEAETGPDNYLMRVSGLRTEGIHKDGHRVPCRLSVRVIKYGGKVEFISSMQPIHDDDNETLGRELLPIPMIDERVQQAYELSKD